MAGGQFALLAGALLAAFLAGMLIQYIRDGVHCDHCHHVETENTSRAE